MPRFITRSLSAAMLVGSLSFGAHAGVAPVGSISILPEDGIVNLSDGMLSMEIWMDFTEATVGGGIDLDLDGPIELVSFTPSDYYENDTDPGFGGHGTATADEDYEVHFGDFGGLDGLNLIGTLEILLLDAGAASVSVAINSTWGDFFSSTGFNKQEVALNGAEFEIAAVPLPAAAWLFAGGLGLLGLRLKRS